MPIVGITTDPYGEIYGYSLVFIRLFDYLSSKNRNLSYLLCNDGESSRRFTGENIIKITLRNKRNLFTKLFTLTVFFIQTTWKKFPKNSVIIVNSEIPELLAGAILKFKFKNTYCYLQDTRIRSKSIDQVLIHLLRMLLIFRINKIMFANKHTMMDVHTRLKYWLGDPVFLTTQKFIAPSIRSYPSTNAYFVGLPSEAKGIQDFAWLAKEFEGRIRFYWFTKYVSPELKSIYPHITFVVNLNDEQLVSHIQKMNIFVNCSHFEGFSLPTAEALFLEKCVLSYKLPEIHSSFGDYVTSYVKPFDLTVFKAVLIDYLDGTIGGDQIFLHHGKQMIIERYSPDVVLNRMLEVIHAHYEK